MKMRGNGLMGEKRAGTAGNRAEGALGKKARLAAFVLKRSFIRRGKKA